MRYATRRNVIEAVQWFKNGDHPQDESVAFGPEPDGITRFEQGMTEGKVVRRFRHPSVSDLRECPICGDVMKNHGWLDLASAVTITQSICPGDYVISLGDGFYSMKRRQFEKMYEKLAD